MMLPRFQGKIIFLAAVLIQSLNGAPLNTEDHEGGFWFGTQSMECMKGKDYSKVKRDAPEVSTIRYIHRVIYYQNQVFEWGNGIRGYHFGSDVAIDDCDVTWDESPAGFSSCPKETIELFSRGYLAKYGGYNLVTNNCHHFVNRVSIILSSSDCQIETDRWQHFSDNFWDMIRPFVDVFDQGTLDNPQEIEKASSRDPNVHNDWPIVKWY